MSASDNDSDKKLRFRLLGVSNSGKSRFAVNSRTGVVEVVGPVEAGERFSLTIGVIDSGGKESQGIMEVRGHTQHHIFQFEYYRTFVIELLFLFRFHYIL